MSRLPSHFVVAALPPPSLFSLFPLQASAGKYQLQQEKTQQALEKAQSDFDRLQEKFERAQNDTRRVSIRERATA